jgi:hypothetical protein
MWNEILKITVYGAFKTPTKTFTRPSCASRSLYQVLETRKAIVKRNGKYVWGQRSLFITSV